MDKFKIFKITENEIIPAENITPKDVVLVSNSQSKSLYVFRGKYSLPLDEFRAKNLYERIINRFLNPNIFLLKTLEEKSGDSEEIINIKVFLMDKYPNLVKYEIKRAIKNILLFESVIEKIKQFKNYEYSSEWRAKLANTTNLWRLSIFNIITIIISLIIMFGRFLYALNHEYSEILNDNGTYNSILWIIWKENLVLILIIIGGILTINLVVNLIFYLFPMKMPIKPKNFELNQESFIREQKVEKLKKPLLPKDVQKMPNLKAPITPPKIDANTKPKVEISKKKLKPEDLVIPTVPIKKKIILQVEQKKLDELAKMETKDTKYILIECQICGQPPIIMPVPKKLIEKSAEPVVDLSYVHGDPKHVIVAQLDHDYQVRRRRSSWVVFED